MINRFKSAFLNAVSNTGLDASVVGLSGNSPRSVEDNNGIYPGSSSRKNSRHGQEPSQETRLKIYEYGRPHFLQLSTADEIIVSADHIVRPIIVPRDLSFLPWESGYAE